VGRFVSDSRFTVLCVASYEKGHDFLRQCHAEGARTILLTSESLKDAPWPRDVLDDVFYMPDIEHVWNESDMIAGVSHLARSIRFDRIVPLDDFDVEKGALLREHLRVGGMGETTARYFRDKLAMRKKAQDSGLPIPSFVGAIHDPHIVAFTESVPPPYVVKPRTQAGAIGIKKAGSVDELWQTLDSLGDTRSDFLIEAFLPGDVWHVDSIVLNGKVAWAVASRYQTPPLETSHLGRVFATRLAKRNTPEEKAVLKLNRDLLQSFGLQRGVSHSEFIRDAAGTFHFLETSARVGGAHIADMIEAGTGVNLWREWAKLEIHDDYAAPVSRKDYAGLLVSLARQERPDLSRYDDPEVVWRMDDKTYHAGVAFSSPDSDRIDALLETYTRRFYDDFFMSLPPQDKATH
jgi:biotin carboxylase